MSVYPPSTLEFPLRKASLALVLVVAVGPLPRLVDCDSGGLGGPRQPSCMGDGSRRSFLHRRLRGRTMVIGVRDAEQFRDRGNWLQRFLRRGTVSMFGGPVAISEAALRADFDDLARWIRAGIPVS